MLYLEPNKKVVNMPFTFKQREYDGTETWRSVLIPVTLYGLSVLSLRLRFNSGS